MKEQSVTRVSDGPGGAAWRARGLVWLVVFVLGLWGCREEPNPFQVTGVVDLGPLDFDGSIRGRDGGYSTLFEGRSVWLFGDTMLNVESEDGERWRTSTRSMTEDLDLSQGLPRFEEDLDGNGAPRRFVQYSEEEAEYNAQVASGECESCEHPWVIWPMDVVVDPETGQALVFYMKIRDWENYGTSIAVWDSLDAVPERPVVRPGTAEPTLLFQGDDPRLGTAAFVHEGYLYAYRCENRCRVGRVAPGEALDREAWRFYAGDGEWSRDSGDAVVVTRANHITSIRWHEPLGHFIAIYSRSGAVMMRSAPAPEGPWSGEVELFEPLKPESGGDVYDAIEHAELSSPDSRTLYVSYSRETGSFLSEMRLVEVRIDDL